MDEFRPSFRATPKSQLNPEFVSGTWVDVSGQVVIRLLFDAVMHTAHVPLVASFDLKLDGVDRPIQGIFWDSPSVLRLVSDPGVPVVEPTTIELTVEDSDLHQLDGPNVLPFGPETLPEL